MPALVLQCGGPTVVVNTTLAALIRRFRALAPGVELYGGAHGLRALLTGDWRDLAGASDDWLAGIEASPGMALGGGRDWLRDDELARGVSLLASRAVDTVFLAGGNGTMASGRALSARWRDASGRARPGTRARVIGIPKTVDNDVPRTDVCPGFPSAARFLVDALRDLGADVASMRGYEDVVLVEAMGRHAGWLAAATLLARARPDGAPHLVLVPERPLDPEAFLSAVSERHAVSGVCVVTVAEGVRDRSGVIIAERAAGALVERDGSGQVILGRSGGPLPHLASLVRERLGLRCRLVRPDLLQRCSRAHVSATDRMLAALAGTAAADAACAGEPTGAVMIALRRAGAGWTTEIVPLGEVRGERTVPPEVLANPELLRDLL